MPPLEIRTDIEGGDFLIANTIFDAMKKVVSEAKWAPQSVAGSVYTPGKGAPAVVRVLTSSEADIARVLPKLLGPMAVATSQLDYVVTEMDTEGSPVGKSQSYHINVTFGDRPGSAS